jgi:hypothetical protein
VLLTPGSSENRRLRSPAGDAPDQTGAASGLRTTCRPSSSKPMRSTAAAISSLSASSYAVSRAGRLFRSGSSAITRQVFKNRAGFRGRLRSRRSTASSPGAGEELGSIRERSRGRRRSERALAGTPHLPLALGERTIESEKAVPAGELVSKGCGARGGSLPLLLLGLGAMGPSALGGRGLANRERRTPR